MDLSRVPNNSYRKQECTLMLWAHAQWLPFQKMNVLDWQSADTLLSAAMPYFKHQQQILLQALDRSNRALAPLSDPLEEDFGTHRWLKGTREETYSDWLAWALEQFKDPSTILHIFGVEDRADVTGHLRITRECVLKEGHEGCGGRVDILIHSDDALILVLELKLGSADAADTEKHQGYARSVPSNVRKVLVAVEGEQPDYTGFELQTWGIVCIRLRRTIAQSKKLTLIARAMLLAFVGSVEQNLLGYPGNIRRYLQTSGTFPIELLNHLKQATMEF